VSKVLVRKTESNKNENHSLNDSENGLESSSVLFNLFVIVEPLIYFRIIVMEPTLTKI